MSHVRSENEDVYSDVKLVENADVAHLYQYWLAWSADPLVPKGYADGYPKTLVEFFESIKSRYVFRLGMVNNEVVGSDWLHDLYPSLDSPTDAWNGLYVMPGHRGSGIQRGLWLRMCEEVDRMGIRHLHGATRVGNKGGERSMRDIQNMYFVGVYPKFALFNGQATDCVIYTRHKSDIDRAWHMAEERVSLLRG